MVKNKNACGVIYEALELCNRCETMRVENESRIRRSIHLLNEMERRYCLDNPTHYDYARALEDLLDKENIVIYNFEHLAAISTLAKAVRE